jgi:RNA methyltransferase, TrmH family
VQVISSQDNKYIKLASSLKHRKYRDMEGLFLVEGRRAVKEALERSELVQAVFWDESLTEQNPMYAAAASVPNCFGIDSRLMKHICSTEEPQGIAAIVRKPAWTWEAVLGQRGLLILLDRISDPGNLGSILRTCWAFGVDGVLLTKGCVDPYNPKVIRSTMGAILNVPVFTDVAAEQLEDLDKLRFSFMSTDISGSEEYSLVKYGRPLVIIFGSEAQGVSDVLKNRCNFFINIPMNPRVDSLNVAAACAIIIAEAGRQHQEGAEMA